LELRNVGANYPFERSRKFRESSRIPATETVRVLSCGCNSGLNIREDSRTIAFDISTAAAAPDPPDYVGAQNRPPNRGRPETLWQLGNQPTSATRSWAAASVAVAGCAGSWSTVAS